MNLNIATAARQRDDHAENDRVEENDYDEENDFHHENQGLTHLLPPQPLPTERQQLVRLLSVARGPGNKYDKKRKAELIQAVATNSKVLSGRIDNEEQSNTLRSSKEYFDNLQISTTGVNANTPGAVLAEHLMGIYEQLENLPPPKNPREPVQKSASNATEAVTKCVEFLRGCSKNSGRAGGGARSRQWRQPTWKRRAG